ncbi:hypothetical protein XA68_12260 [Ophiocordyceps unilateralis]|uniref:Uncharacterized protein n=1 Tax=Ophiocordyceps unilateralis TaxID=268505 RepID=A0A2A9PF41_OPHUN|nr:hypothetical protein XA68_12260 [Ophiocordyceps unilateralis]
MKSWSAIAAFAGLALAAPQRPPSANDQAETLGGQLGEPGQPQALLDGPLGFGNRDSIVSDQNRPAMTDINRPMFKGEGAAFVDSGAILAQKRRRSEVPPVLNRNERRYLEEPEMPGLMDQNKGLDDPDVATSADPPPSPQAESRLLRRDSIRGSMADDKPPTDPPVSGHCRTTEECYEEYDWCMETNTPGPCETQPRG